MKKILMINPWAVNNDEYYTSGLVNSLNDYVKLDLATNWFYRGKRPNNKTYRIFFKKSEHSSSKFRRLIRGFEYITTYYKLLKVIHRAKYDYIHIQWLLMYRFDTWFIKKMKKENCKVVLTAHNVIPHISGEKYLRSLKKIYSIVDLILVHGESIRQELLDQFPFAECKVKIQPHGAILERKKLDSNVHVEHEIKEKMADRECYIMFGNHFFNKGTDRLLRIWRKYFSKDDRKLLIIVGRKDSKYMELEQELSLSVDSDWLLWQEGYVSDEILDYLIFHSEAVLLPYRHASMSGVIFTAAEYSKAVLCTDVGALHEYLENGIDSIVIENSEKAFAEGLVELSKMGVEKRKQMGEKLYYNINKKYSWNKIAEYLIENVYV